MSSLRVGDAIEGNKYFIRLDDLKILPLMWLTDFLAVTGGIHPLSEHSHPTIWYMSLVGSELRYFELIDPNIADLKRYLILCI